MSLSTSYSDTGERAESVADEGAPRSARLLDWIYPAGIVVTAVAFALGAWQRRWIADDGLIVLRTVRNLLAGNGPVFNVGERVETNTSTAWTYIVWFFSWISQARLEYVVLTVALVLSVAAIVFSMLGAGLLAQQRFSGPSVLLPAGALVYIAVPPARDYATSGLESCLVIFWIALLWWLLMRWSLAERPRVLGLAFLAGLAPLVRPELAMVGALALLLLVVVATSWRTRVLIAVVAGIVPLGYQIWRMGYYALPYPNTAVAKDAAGAKWVQGFTYLWNLAGPYWLWLPLGVLLATGWIVWRGRRVAAPPRAAGLAGLRQRLHSPSAVVVLILVSGLLLGVYALRVGGDFMHGRVLLPTLFCLVTPVAVLPVSRDRRGAVGAVAVAAVAVWAVIAANTVATGTTIKRDGIVDERAYYVLYTGHDHPILAEDYLDYPRMRSMVRVINEQPNGGLLINVPSFTYWDVVPPPEPIPPGGAGHTVYFLNLGMTSMNVGLDVRVIDQMGLAYPLAAHSDRLVDGRIGHDKHLYADWVVADLGLVEVHPWLPSYMDEEWIAEAKVALSCPQTQELLTSYRSELTFDRWKQNLKHAFTFAKYRFDRVPKYEIQRCKLPPPPPRPDK